MRWVKWVAVAIATMVLLLVAIIYGGSEWVLQRRHGIPATAIVADRSPAGLREGERLARIANCQGCHRPGGIGLVMTDTPPIGRFVAPAIARRAPAYSDAELARLIRRGVKRDGTALFIMPTQALTNLADADLAKILGWVRTLKPGPHDIDDRMSFGPLGRVLLLSGAMASKVRPTATVVPAARPPDTGRYLVQISCMACHALHEAHAEEGDATVIIPALAEVGPAYDPAAFRTFLRTGVGMSGRDLGLMSRVAKGDLHVLTDAEIAAIHAYLTKSAQRPTQ